MRNEIEGQQKSYIRCVSEQAVICYEVGRHFVLKFLIYRRFKHDKSVGRYFLRGLFRTEMVDKMWQGVIV